MLNPYTTSFMFLLGPCKASMRRARSAICTDCAISNISKMSLAIFLSIASALDHDVQVQRQSRAGAKHAGYRLERAVRHARDELWGASDSCASMGGCRLWAISSLSA